MTYKIIEKNIDEIREGDTVIHNEKMRTVGRSSLDRCKFMGQTLFGDCYHLGLKPVKLVQIKKTSLQA